MGKMDLTQPESLRIAAKALDDYAENVGASLTRLFDAADACRENMKEDKVSKKASEDVMRACKPIAILIKQAGEVSASLKQLANQIDNL